MPNNSFQEEDVNITSLYTYYTSSESHWEKYNQGHPLDGYIKHDRFSFHTEEELDPFIVISSLEPIDITKVAIYLRAGYETKMLPLQVFTSTDKRTWRQIDDTYLIVAGSSVFINKAISDVKHLKIRREGYSCLYLSSVSIFSSRKYLIQNKARIVNQYEGRCVISYTPFYGLGGQLAVLATAIGYLQTSSYNNLFWYWRDYQSGLVDFPPELPKGSHINALFQNDISASIAANFTNDKLRQKSSKAVPSWLPPSGSSTQSRPLVCISRDQIQSFVLKGEHLYECTRRLYSQIKPSEIVLDMVSTIEREFKIADSSYLNTLGLQVRHGNGEKYQSGVNWGVKPPSVDRLIQAIDDAIHKSNLDIKNIIVAADSFSVRDVLEKSYKNKYKILFISTEIQDVGGGSNPSPAVFDSSVKRRDVDMRRDDKRAFAELLILSKCAAICGGKSFFYNAIVGFSRCDIKQIYRINNLDRYIDLPEGYSPLGQAGADSPIAEKVLNLFRQLEISIDGIFVDKDLLSEKH